MADRINVAEFRSFVESVAAGRGRGTWASVCWPAGDILALIDAVEAAKRNSVDGGGHNQITYDLVAALARFDFGETPRTAEALGPVAARDSYGYPASGSSTFTVRATATGSRSRSGRSVSGGRGERSLTGLWPQARAKTALALIRTCCYLDSLSSHRGAPTHGFGGA